MGTLGMSVMGDLGTKILIFALQPAIAQGLRLGGGPLAHVYVPSYQGDSLCYVHFRNDCTDGSRGWASGQSMIGVLVGLFLN